MMWTKQTLSEMTIPKGKRKLVITDPDTRGLIFEVREQSRSFYLRYSFEGKQRTVALGPFPTLSLADARRKAEDLKRKVYMGENPLEAKQTKSKCSPNSVVVERPGKDSVTLTTFALWP